MRYESKDAPRTNIAKRIYILIPEVNIRTIQEKITNNVWPISGWIIKSIEITEIKIVDIKYLIKIFDLLLHKIVAKIIIKNGFNNSIGWNLGKKNRSIHLFEPLTSTPMNGTKNKEISEIKKRIIEYLYNWSEFNKENIKIRDIPINT